MIFFLIFGVQIVRHELGHSLGMGHTYTENYPPDWDCGPRGSIMSGNDKGQLISKCPFGVSISTEKPTNFL